MAIISGSIQQNRGQTYGAISLPFTPSIFEPVVDEEKATSLKGKLKTAFNKTKDAVKGAFTSPKETFEKLTTYLSDERNMEKLKNGALAKFSGIAVAQTLISGKVETKEALDYLFLGFAPALNVTAASLGYVGLTQMKDALANGTINVGSFVNGLSTSLKGVTDLKDQIQGKDTLTKGNLIEIDLTISHSETYQAETPDRRVESGNTMSETVHNLPLTIRMECAIEDGKRYTTSDLRAVFTELRNKKELVTVYLGEDTFEDMCLVNFEPNKDTTRSGFDYSLEFKQVNIGIVDFQPVNLQPTLDAVKEDVSTTTVTTSTAMSASGNASAKIKSVATANMDNVPMPDDPFTSIAKNFGGKLRYIQQRVKGGATYIVPIIELSTGKVITY